MTRVLYYSPHQAASDNGDGVSSLWLREYSSDKEPIRDFYKDHPIRKRATTGTHFRATRTQRPMHGAHANRGNSFLADRKTSGEANH